MGRAAMNRVHRQIINEAMAPSALDMNPAMEPFDAQAEEAKEAAQRPEPFPYTVRS